MYRRDVLASSLAVTIGAVAGCVGDDGRETGWFLDPEQALGVPNVAVVDVDATALQEHRDDLPVDLRREVERLEDTVEAHELDDIDRIVGTAYLGPETAERGAVGGLEGDFRPDDLRSAIRLLGLDPAGGEEFDRYVGGNNAFEAAMAVSTEAVVAALVDGDTNPERLLDGALAVASGDEPSAADRSAISELRSRLEESDIVVALAFELDPVTEGPVIPTDRTMERILSGVEAVGFGARIDGEQTRLQHVFDYGTPEVTADGAIEAFVSELTASDAVSFRDASVETTGPYVTATVTADTLNLPDDYRTTFSPVLR